MTIRFANAASSPDDCREAAAALVAATSIDYLTLSYDLADLLPESTRPAGNSTRFVTSFLDVLSDLCPAFFLQPQLNALTTAGGADPAGCAHAAAHILCERGNPDLSLAVVRGDDLRGRLEELLAQGCPLERIGDQTPFAELTQPIVSAHAILGSTAVAVALGQQARLVITGQVVAEGLCVGPALREFGGDQIDDDVWAGAVVAGRILRHGAAITWDNRGDVPAAPGQPIIDFSPDGSFRLSTTPGSEGELTADTITAGFHQGKPAESAPPIVTPDLIVDVSQLQVAPDQGGTLRVSGATGARQAGPYEVAITYRDGFSARAFWRVDSGNLSERNDAACRIMVARMRQAGFPVPRIRTSEIGSEIVRWDVCSGRLDDLERFSREFSRLARGGLQGIEPLADVSCQVQPRLAEWRTTVPRDLVDVMVDCRPARDWL